MSVENRLANNSELYRIAVEFAGLSIRELINEEFPNLADFSLQKIFNPAFRKSELCKLTLRQREKLRGITREATNLMLGKVDEIFSGILSAKGEGVVKAKS